VNQYFELIISLPVQKDIEKIRKEISAYSNDEDAGYEWGDGLSKVVNTLKTVPFHQAIERETGVGKAPVRKILYRQQGVRCHYHVLYMVDSFPVPDPEPNRPYLAGCVVILFVRHASQKPLTDEALEKRIGAVHRDIAEVDALRKELEDNV
jgi:hypothetical protein